MPAYRAVRNVVNVWFYDEGYETYTDNPEICQVLYSEMLANHTHRN